MTQLKVTKDQAEVYLGKMEVGIAQKEKKEEKKNQLRRTRNPKVPFQNVTVFCGFIMFPKCLSYFYGFNGNYCTYFIVFSRKSCPAVIT